MMVFTGGGPEGGRAGNGRRVLGTFQRRPHTSVCRAADEGGHLSDCRHLNLEAREYSYPFSKIKLQEMMSLESQRKVFGRVQHLNDANEFLDAVDGQDEGVTVLVLLFEPNGHGCPSAVHAVTQLAQVCQLPKF